MAKQSQQLLKTPVKRTPTLVCAPPGGGTKPWALLQERGTACSPARDYLAAQPDAVSSTGARL